MSYAKPQMKGLFLSRFKVQIPGVLAFAGLCSYGIYHFGYRYHKKAYEEFYKTYDAEADYQRMKSYGLFKSIPCQGPLSPPETIEEREPAVPFSGYLDDINSLIQKYKAIEKKRILAEEGSS